MIAVYVLGDLHVRFTQSVRPGVHHVSNLPHMPGREPELRGIDESTLHIGARLPRTSTRVGRIDETAVAAQVGIEVASRSREDLAKVDRSDADDFRAHFVVDAEDRAQNEHQPLAAVEAEQGAHRARDLDLFDQDLNRYRHGSRI